MSTSAAQNDSTRRRRNACERLRERMQASSAVRVEDLLAEIPELADDDDALLELILTEISARRDRGDEPTAAEWVDRLRNLIPNGRRRDAIESLLSTEMKTLSEASVDAPPPPPRARIGRYHVLEEIGRGGMGVVYKARQTNPNRFVAIKMILAGDHANARERARLRTEAEAAAKLTHPNIVQVIEADYHEGLPFLVMEYVDGGNLAQMIRSAPQPIRWSVRLIETIAVAIHEAHRVGIVHRDINPTNILMTMAGAPKISDFGLAKFLLAEVSGTQSGRILGTPSYMAPEQISGKPRIIDVRTDVYALGAVLYEMLTGTPPYRSQTPMETLCQVAEGQLVPPSKLRHGLPTDLETICLKCLDRTPAARYTDARALADDLRRFQNREPIRARRTSKLRRGVQWARRQPQAATFLAISMLLLMMLLGAGVYEHYRAEKIQELYSKIRVGSNVQAISSKRSDTENELALRSSSDYRLGRIYAHASRGELEVALEAFNVLKRTSPREEGFEWRYVDRMIHRTARLLSDDSAHQTPVVAIAPSRDGRTLIAGDAEGRLVAWDVDSGVPTMLTTVRGRRTVALAVASDPEGRPTAFASVHVDEEGAIVSIRNASDPQEDQEIQEPIVDVAEIGFLEAGSVLALRCRTIDDDLWKMRVYRNRAGFWTAAPDEEIADAVCAAFSPTGVSLAVGRGDGSILIHDFARRIANLQPPEPSQPAALVFSSDGRSLATGWRDGRIVAWDLDADAPIAVLDPIPNVDPPRFLGFGPRRESVVIQSGSRRLSLRELRPGGRTVALSGPDASPTRLAVSPDGRRLVAGFESRHLLVWDLERPMAEPRRYGDLLSPTALAYSPSGDALFLTFDQEGVFVRPVVPGPSPRMDLAGHAAEAWSLAFSPDGSILASGGDDHQIKLWDVATGAELAAVAAHAQTVTGLAFAPSGDQLASVSLDGSWKIWRPIRDPDGGVRLELQHTLRPQGASQLRCVTYSADGRRIAASGLTPDILLNRPPHYDAPTILAGAHSAMITSLAFAKKQPDFLASASCDRDFRVWEPEEGNPLGIAVKGDGPLMALAFSTSDDGSGMLLAAGGARRQVFLLDPLDFKLGSPIREHPASIRALAFSTRGDTLATGCDDGRVRLCDVETRQVVIALDGHQGRINAVAFSPDDSTLASCSHSGQVILWKAGPPPPL